MDSLTKFQLMGEYLNLEQAEEITPGGEKLAVCSFTNPTSCPPSNTTAKSESLPIYWAALPNGRRTPLLKTMLTSACERNCSYCAFNRNRNYRRMAFKPEEMAKAFMDMYRARMVEGLFLSSGLAGGGIRTQDQLIAAAEILRFKLGFRGYLHLKLMPGAEFAQVERAMQLADRVSVNLEAPNDQRLAVLAPQKIFLDELLKLLQWVEQIRQTQPPHLGWNGHWPSITTQFVVGAVGENDLELLATTSALYQKLHLARAYYSKFSPVPGTPLENHPPENPQRQHRLYQASFLLHDYGFSLEDLPFAASGYLPLNKDPKIAWAQDNLSESPLEINRADVQELLRVPGIGPKGARYIIAARRRGRLRQIEDLKNSGVIVSRAIPFILLDGRRPTYQLSLFQDH